VTYALGPAATVIIIQAGDRPDGSGVHSFDRVVLREPFPPAVAEALDPRPDDNRVHLGFVRLPEGCLALGRLRIGSAQFRTLDGAGRSMRMEECSLQIVERLSFDVLDRVRPPCFPASLPELEWIKLLPRDPVRALRGFMAGWFADVPPLHDDSGPAKVPLPAPLLEFYRTVAGRRELLGGFNRIHTPDEVLPYGPGEVEDGFVAFGSECQGGWDLVMDPTIDDPPVVYVGLADYPVVERERLSAFLMQFALADAAIASPFGGFARVSGEQLRELVKPLQQVPLYPMRWPADPTYLYVGPGLVVSACLDVLPVMRSWSMGGRLDSDRDSYEVHVGSRHRAALRPIREPGFRWEHFTG
jgi:hypothetical protein